MATSLSQKQFRIALAIAALVFSAIMAGMIAWLAFNSETTIQRRMEKTPNAVAVLPGQEPEVPSSWQKPEEKPAEAMPQAEAATELPQTAAAPEATPEQTPSATEQPAPAAEEKQPAAETPAPEAAKEEVKPDAPKSEEKPQAAAQPETTVSAAPSVETNPVQEAAAPLQKWQKLARPFDQTDTRPRIGLIIMDLGLAGNATQAAIQDLPGEVSLAFSSLAPDVEGWISKARVAGHETLLTIPMEPNNYPQNDPGPNALLLGLPNKDNVSRMRWAMARSDGYVAIMPSMGEKFVTSEEKLLPVLDVVKEQGVMVLDATGNKDSLIAPLSRLGKIAFARSDMLLDAAAARNAIETQLAELEKTAQAKGSAIAIALPYPVTFELLKAWLPTLKKKGIVLAPLTALASEEVPVVQAAPVQ